VREATKARRTIPGNGDSIMMFHLESGCRQCVQSAATSSPANQFHDIPMHGMACMDTMELATIVSVVATDNFLICVYSLW